MVTAVAILMVAAATFTATVIWGCCGGALPVAVGARGGRELFGGAVSLSCRCRGSHYRRYHEGHYEQERCFVSHFSLQ